MANKATYEQVVQRLAVVTDRLSTQVRTLSIGLIAFTWGLFTGESAIAKELAQSFKKQIIVIGCLAISALLFDLLQYVAGYKVSKKLLDSMDREKLQEAEFDYRELSYRAQNWFFILKQCAVILACFWLLVRVIIYLLGRG